MNSNNRLEQKSHSSATTKSKTIKVIVLSTISYIHTYVHIYTRYTYIILKALPLTNVLKTINIHELPMLMDNAWLLLIYSYILIYIRRGIHMYVGICTKFVYY